MDYGPRYCAVCGVKFIPIRKNQMSCGSPICVKKYRNRNNYKYKLKYKEEGHVPKRRKKQEPAEPKKDTLIAIGYAERQMAQTLEMVGKVKV